MINSLSRCAFRTMGIMPPGTSDKSHEINGNSGFAAGVFNFEANPLGCANKGPGGGDAAEHIAAHLEARGPDPGTVPKISLCAAMSIATSDPSVPSSPKSSRLR